MGTFEQRKAIRFNVELAAEILTSNEVLAASTKNLSETGVCLELSKTLEEGSLVGLSLFLTNEGIEDPDKEQLNVKAQVIWCSENEGLGFTVGARFSDLDEASRKALEDFFAAIG